LQALTCSNIVTTTWNRPWGYLFTSLYRAIKSARNIQLLDQLKSINSGQSRFCRFLTGFPRQSMRSTLQE